LFCWGLRGFEIKELENLPYFTEKKKMLMHFYYINFYNFSYTSLVVLGVIQKRNKKFKIVEIINALLNAVLNL